MRFTRMPFLLALASAAVFAQTDSPSSSVQSANSSSTSNTAELHAQTGDNIDSSPHNTDRAKTSAKSRRSASRVQDPDCDDTPPVATHSATEGKTGITGSSASGIGRPAAPSEAVHNKPTGRTSADCRREHR